MPTAEHALPPHALVLVLIPRSVPPFALLAPPVPAQVVLVDRAAVHSPVKADAQPVPRVRLDRDLRQHPGLEGGEDRHHGRRGPHLGQRGGPRQGELEDGGVRPDVGGQDGKVVDPPGVELDPRALLSFPLVIPRVAFFVRVAHLLVAVVVDHLVVGVDVLEPEEGAPPPPRGRGESRVDQAAVVLDAGDASPDDHRSVPPGAAPAAEVVVQSQPGVDLGGVRAELDPPLPRRLHHPAPRRGLPPHGLGLGARDPERHDRVHPRQDVREGRAAVLPSDEAGEHRGQAHHGVVRGDLADAPQDLRPASELREGKELDPCRDALPRRGRGGGQDGPAAEGEGRRRQVRTGGVAVESVVPVASPRLSPLRRLGRAEEEVVGGLLLLLRLRLRLRLS
mmetsp:Transcript_3374/g.7464  ORF Transcript_3374/g.7464 Transcript_3374/m.7464 type:complete len:393 (+) Transcript_3374:750-1928(+)